MVDITKLKSMVIKYDAERAQPAKDYSINRKRLSDMVELYGHEVVAIATGFTESTIKQHCRNKNGTAMISSYRLDRAEHCLAKL